MAVEDMEEEADLMTPQKPIEMFGSGLDIQENGESKTLRGFQKLKSRVLWMHENVCVETTTPVLVHEVTIWL